MRRCYPLFNAWLIQRTDEKSELEAVDVRATTG
jgi:hypothetical protein